MTAFFARRHNGTPRVDMRWAVGSWICLCCLFCGCSDPLRGLKVELQHSDPQRRRSAVQQILESGSDAATRPLLHPLLNDPDTDVRRLACRALGMSGREGQASLPFLRLSLGDDEYSVRVAAAFAIASIEPQSVAPAEVLVPAMKAGDGGIIVQVGRLGSQASWSIPALVSLLQTDERAGIRRLAAEALRSVGAGVPKVDSALLEAARSDPDDRVREAARDPELLGVETP